MVHILTALIWCLSVIVILYALYYFIISIFTLAKKKKQAAYPPKNRFAFVIAARNEECVIGNLVDSLLKQNYPKDLYTVYVVPNNCTDGTKEAALAAGASIIDCTIPVKSKGEVLSFALDYIFRCDDTYDAMCVCDADNLVHPNFLSEMNNALCSGKKVAQGYRDSKNPHDTAISCCYSLYYWMVNRFHNHARDALGLSAMVNGSGFMVSMDILKENGGWKTYTRQKILNLPPSASFAVKKWPGSQMRLFTTNNLLPLTSPGSSASAGLPVFCRVWADMAGSLCKRLIKRKISVVWIR